MKRSAGAALVFVLAFLLLSSACGAQKSGTQMSIYRAVSPYYLTDGTLVAVEEVPLNPGVGIINSAISAFNAAPGDQELRNPLPAGARVYGYALEGGVLRLETEGCEAMDGIDRTVLYCCAALTFCGIDGVNAVSIWSGGTEVCPPLSPHDIVLADASATSES